MSRYRTSPRLPRIAVAFGLRDRLAEGYRSRDLRSDAVAGVVVGAVALPLSMALAIASGAPPQHGLYTAIVAGIVVAVLGGSRYQITGPTAAFVALLAPIAIQHGLGGLLIAGLMAGVIQVVMGLARLGKLIEFVPHPVTTGFTAGIAIVIALIQLPTLFGLELGHVPDDVIGRLTAYWDARQTWSQTDTALGLATLGALFAVPRTSKVPAALVVPIVATVVGAALIHFTGADLVTIGSRFTSTVGGEIVHGIPRQPPSPSWPWSHGGPGGAVLHVDLELIRQLAPAAFAIAMLGAIESLLSAVVADSSTGQRHDPDAELVALGIGNMLCPFFGGIPATAALARTATNIRAGATSPLSSIFHAVFVLASVMVLAPWVAHLPMATMAALLLFVAYNMSDAGHVIRLVRTAPRSDVLVMLTCLSLTVIFDMVIAVGVGVVLAALSFMRRMADLTQVELHGDLSGDIPLPDHVSLYRVHGPLFFGAAQRAMGTLSPPPGTRAVVLDMSSVPVIDATGLVALDSALQSLVRGRCKVILAGLDDPPRRTLHRAGMVKRAGELAFAPDLDTALSMAAVHSARPVRSDNSTASMADRN